MLLLQTPFVAVHAAPVAAQQEQLAASLDALLAPQFKAKGPGATIIATKDGKTVFRKAYGMADVAAKQPLTPDALLRIGSITKQFTAIGILMLADEGKLALSDDITRFLPTYPTGGQKITIEHLLTHTSGIVSYTSKSEFGALSGKDASVEQGIDFFKNDPLEFAPGSQFKYNNSGYFVLGAIIEKASGQSYASFVEQRIAKPLGMTGTGYEGATDQLKPVLGHSHRNGQAQPSDALSMSWPYSAGALVSTIDDLARWHHGLASGKLVSPKTLKRAFAKYQLSDGKPGPYGYGWFIGELYGSPMIFHNGDINGFAADAVWLPNERIYVAVLSNADADGTLPNVGRLSRHIATKLLNKPFPKASNAKLDATTLAGYVGVYPIDDKASHTVRAEKGALSIQGTGMPRAPLVYYKTDGFLIGDTMITVAFSRDAIGVVRRLAITDDQGVKVHQRAQTVVTERPTVRLAPAVLEQYLGRYPLAPGFVMEVTRKGEKLHVAPVGQASVEVSALAEEVFHVAENNAELRFEKQADGTMKLFLTQGSTKLSGQRQM